MLVLQNSGAIHLVHPNANCVLRSFVIDSDLYHGLFAITTHKYNPNGIFIVNERGTIAETYTLVTENKLKRLPSFRDAFKNAQECEGSSHDGEGKYNSADSELKSDASREYMNSSKSPQKKGWLDKKIEKAKK